MNILTSSLRVAACMALVIAPLASHADWTVKTERQLTSEQLVEQVLNANASLKASGAQLAASQLHASYATDWEDPQFSYAIAPQSVGNSIGTRHIVQLSQIVPTRGKQRDRGLLAESSADLARSNTEDIAARLAVEARIVWTQWWLVHRAVQLNAENQRVIRQLVPLAEAQYGTGRGLQQDVLQAQTRSERLRLEAVRLRQQQRRLKARINGLRGEHPQAVVNPPAVLPDWRKLPDSSLLYEQLKEGDPRFRQLAARASGAAARQSLARKASTPDVRANVAYLGTLDPDEKRFQLGFSMSFPFNRARLKAVADAATAEQEGIAFEVADAEARIAAELSQALISAEEATEASLIYRQSLIPKARQTLAAAQADYESTAGEFSNVIAAESQLLELQLELARTRADWRIAAAMVERITNSGLWESK